MKLVVSYLCIQLLLLSCVENKKSNGKKKQLKIVELTKTTPTILGVWNCDSVIDYYHGKNKLVSPNLQGFIFEDNFKVYTFEKKMGMLKKMVYGIFLIQDKKMIIKHDDGKQEEWVMQKTIHDENVMEWLKIGQSNKIELILYLKRISNDSIKM